MNDLRESMIEALGEDYVKASEQAFREAREKALESQKDKVYTVCSLDMAFYRKAEDYIYKLSFKDFIDFLNIAENYKKYETAYKKEIDETVKGYLNGVDCPEEFSDNYLVSDFANPDVSISSYVSDILDNILIWGTDTSRYMDVATSSVITACVPCLECTGDEYADATYWEFSPCSGTAISEFSNYVSWVKEKVWCWFLEGYLKRNKLVCTDGTVFMDLEGDASEWSNCLMTSTDILSRIVFSRALYKKDWHFVVSTGTPYERPLMRFLLKNMKDALGFRILYSGLDAFPVVEREGSEDDWDYDEDEVDSDARLSDLPFSSGETYEECFTKSVFNLPMQFMDSVDDYFEVVNSVGNEGYVFVEKSSEEDIDVEGIIKSNRLLARYCRKEL